MVVLCLCVTGVLLTYERQIEHWLTAPQPTAPIPDAEPLPLGDLLARAQETVPLSPQLQVVVSRAPDAPVAIRQGRRSTALLDPYTGEAVEPHRAWIRDAFSFITRFHRWFALEDEARDRAKFTVGVANLAFLFLVVSGLYLWFPRVLRRRAFSMRLFFSRRPASSRARDYNWHHVLGIWMAIPLLVLIVTGSVFSFRWTGDVIYAALGVERPERAVPAGGRGQGPRGARGQAQGGGRAFNVATPAGMLTLDQLAQVASEVSPDWRELAITLPRPRQAEVEVLIDCGSGGQPTLRETIKLDRVTGKMVERTTFEQLPAAQRIRGTIRFLHTGEYFGVIGQTIAGLASLAGVLMVWTGLALAYRRLVQPMVNRRKRRRLKTTQLAADSPFSPEAEPG